MLWCKDAPMAFLLPLQSIDFSKPLQCISLTESQAYAKKHAVDMHRRPHTHLCTGNLLLPGTLVQQPACAADSAPAGLPVAPSNVAVYSEQQSLNYELGHSNDVESMSDMAESSDMESSSDSSDSSDVQSMSDAGDVSSNCPTSCALVQVSALLCLHVRCVHCSVGAAPPAQTCCMDKR